MINEHDIAIQVYAREILAHLPARSPTRLPAQPPSQLPSHEAPGGRAALPGRRCEGVRMGLRCIGRLVPPAAMRVLETTWRVWREPLG